MKNKDYLVRFTYDNYCQGWEDEIETILVRNAPSFEAACNRVVISGKFQAPREFHNMTIDLDEI